MYCKALSRNFREKIFLKKLLQLLLSKQLGGTAVKIGDFQKFNETSVGIKNYIQNL